MVKTAWFPLKHSLSAVRGLFRPVESPPVAFGRSELPCRFFNEKGFGVIPIWRNFAGLKIKLTNNGRIFGE